MKQLSLFFGDDAASILTCLRLRRRLTETADQLSERKSILETQIEEFKEQYGEDAKAAHQSVVEADQRLKDVTQAESRTRNQYERTSSEIRGFWRCLLTSARGLFQTRPGVNGMCKNSRYYSEKWKERLKELDIARTVSTARGIKYRKLVSNHESDLFAIRQIDAHLERIHGQIKTEELTIAAIIRFTARCLSYASLARKCAAGLEIHGAVSEDIIELKKILNQLESLRGVHAISLAEQDSGANANGWMQAKFFGNRPKSDRTTGSGLKTIEKAVAHGFHEQNISFDCEVPVRGTGSADRTKGSQWTEQSAPPPSLGTTAIIFSDTLQLKRKLLQNQWDSKRVGLTISTSGINQFAMAIETHLESTTSPLIKALESKEAELMQRITKTLLSRLGN